MKKLFCVLLTVALAQFNALAAFDAFLEIEDIEGESTDAAHPKTIDVLSYSWGMSNPTTVGGGGSGGGAGKVSMQDFHFAKFVDKSSTSLMKACATGQHIKKATLYVRDTRSRAGLDYLIVTFEDLLISSFQTGGSAGGDARPTESVSFNYGKVKVQYFVLSPKGTIEGGPTFEFDLKANRAE